MKIKHLFGACLLLSSLAACTSQEDIPTPGGNDITTPEGAVVFSLEGLGSGSVDTRAGTVIATSEENRIDALDIYVFAYDADGAFDANPATDTGLTPGGNAEADDNDHWFLQEKWSYVKSDGKFANPGMPNVDTTRPDMHEILTLGGSGVARTAVIYPKEGRHLKFFIVANGPKLVATDGRIYEPKFNAEGDPATTDPGTSAAEFLGLRLELTHLNAAGAINARPIACPLPMTTQMASTKVALIDMTAATGSQVTVGATLTRAVTRFDVANYAGPQTKGDFRLNEVYVYNTYQHVAMNNLAAAGATPFAAPIWVNLAEREWKKYTNKEPGSNFFDQEYYYLPSAFYTSPTLAATTVELGLRGDLGSTTAAAGTKLEELNKNVKIMDPANTTDALVLKANYRYLLNIKKLGPDINVIFSILDWDSEILDADFSNAPMPTLIVEDDPRFGLEWKVADDNMDNHLVSMSNTRPGDLSARLAFGLGTYNEDELADIIASIVTDANGNVTYDSDKVPFAAEVLSLSQDESHPADNIWLTQPEITFPITNTARDRFQVVMNVRPESEVPLDVRPDLLVRIWNKEKTQKMIQFRVVNTWVAPDAPVVP